MTSNYQRPVCVNSILSINTKSLYTLEEEYQNIYVKNIPKTGHLETMIVATIVVIVATINKIA